MFESPPGDKSALTIKRWPAIGLAAVTGCLYYISFPGVDLWPVAFIAWVPWMVALRGQSSKDAALQGLALGLVVGVLGFYWLLDMLQIFSGFSTPLCALFMLLLCAYQGGRFVLLGVLFARATHRGFGAGLAFFAAFIASETAYPLLFPFTFGASLHDAHPFVQVADLGGPIAVALTALAPSWAIAELIQRYRIKAKQGIASPLTVRRQLVLAAVFCVPLVSACYGLIRISQVDEAVEAAEKLRVGIVQANMSLEAKRQDRNEGLRRHTRLTEQLRRKEKVELVVWPETSVAGAVHEERVNDYYEQSVTGRLRVPAIVGAVIYREVEDARGHVLFNSALMADERGKITGRYDKQFLLAFGEYLPFGEMFPILHEWSPNSGRFTPGTSFEPLDFRGKKLSVFICYEDIVPSFVNRLMNHSEVTPHLLINMTNDAWFGDSSEPWEHLALSKLRAVEQRRFFVRSTNSGMSGIVDPVGRLIAKSETFTEATLAADVAFLELGSGYRIWGNGPWWAMTALSLAMAFFRRKSSN